MCTNSQTDYTNGLDECVGRLQSRLEIQALFFRVFQANEGKREASIERRATTRATPATGEGAGSENAKNSVYSAGYIFLKTHFFKKKQFYTNIQGYHRFVLGPAIINDICQLSRGSVNREKSFAVNLMIRQMGNREKCRSSTGLK